MTQVEELEKLIRMRDQKVISKKEFEERKAALLEEDEDSETDKKIVVGDKKQIIYCLLSLLAIFGLHNFYLKRLGQAIPQAILGGIATIIICFFKYHYSFSYGWNVSLVFVFPIYLWASLNVFLTHRDGMSKEMLPTSKIIKIVSGIILILLPIIVSITASVLSYMAAY